MMTASPVLAPVDSAKSPCGCCKFWQEYPENSIVMRSRGLSGCWGRCSNVAVQKSLVQSLHETREGEKISGLDRDDVDACFHGEVGEEDVIYSTLDTHTCGKFCKRKS